jgi:hypothetical protein
MLLSVESGGMHFRPCPPASGHHELVASHGNPDSLLGASEPWWSQLMEKVYRSLLRKANFLRRKPKLTGQDGAAKPSHSGSNEGTGPSPPPSPWCPGWRSLRPRFGCQPKKLNSDGSANPIVALHRFGRRSGGGRAFALVSLRSAVSAARQVYVVHPWHRACTGCHVPTATLHAECHVA